MGWLEEGLVHCEEMMARQWDVVVKGLGADIRALPHRWII
jgi:hypothetical protein